MSNLARACWPTATGTRRRQPSGPYRAARTRRIELGHYMRGLRGKAFARGFNVFC